MFRSLLLWRMAARNAAAQRSQTAMTLFGGAVGVMLAVAAVVFWTSFDESGMRWLRAHIGTIDWELRPAEGADAFTAEQTERIASRLQGELKAYPAVTALVSAKHDAQQKAAPHLLVIGVDPGSALLPEDGALIAADDRVIVSVPVAERLAAKEGDVLAITGADGEERLFKVSAVVPERGLTGYRGAERAAGTILMNTAAARALTGAGETEYNTVFASQSDSVTLDSPQFRVYFPDIPYVVVEIKKDAVSTVLRMKSQYGATFLVASALAVAAGLVLMRELFLMLADQRRVRFAALRALGFSRRDVRRVYLAEAIVLNVGSVALGALLGLALGAGILQLFRTLYQGSLYRFAVTEVPILPFISVPHVLLAAAVLFAANTAVGLLAARAVSRLPIAAALRGDARPGGAGRGRAATWRGRLQTAFAAAILAAFAYLAVSGEIMRQLAATGPEMPYGLLAALAVWLAAPFALLYFFAQGLGPLSGLAARTFAALRVPRLPVLLALRYPQQNPRRVLSVSALFAIVGLMITMVMTIGGQAVADMERKAEGAGLMGYSAYIPYADEAQKARLLGTLEGSGFPIRPIEPYRINIHAPGVFGEMINVSVFDPDEAYFAETGVKLSARAPGFATDEDVWRELRANPDAIVLHKLFSYDRKEWGPTWWAYRILPDEPIRPGDTLKLDIYERFISSIPENNNVLHRTVTVLGFVDVDHSYEFYHLMLTSPQFYEDYRHLGFQWENTQALGYLMIGLDTSDLAAVERLEERLLLGGVDGLRIPGLEQSGNATLLRHTLSIYVAFMVVAALIGLAGLAIVQMRAIREREPQLGMMRCIGVRKSHLAALFLIEGAIISSVGLAVGWAFGTIGGYWIYSLSVSTANPLTETVPFHYPALTLAGIMGAILLAAFALNTAPALRSLSLSPGAAVRSSE